MGKAKMPTDENSAHPSERPDFETLYKQLLCEVYALRQTQYKDWHEPTALNRSEKFFRERLVDDFIAEELKYLGMLENNATQFIPLETLPY
jgi:hypothetical protein